MTTIAFEQFRADLDDHSDRREQLIKSSRDVTNLSKRAIFVLHRVMIEGSDTDSDHSSVVRAAALCHEKLTEVRTSFAHMKPELEGDRYWRYQYQISPGLQEYIEALAFAHYLEHRSLITFEQVQKTLCGSDGVPYFPLTVSDYLLGVSDLTGELMRYAISAISRPDGRSTAFQVCGFVRSCKADFERMTPYVYGLAKKQKVTAQSLEKIEDAVYAISVRGSEYALPQSMLDDIVTRTMSRLTSRGDVQIRDYENENDHDGS